MPGTKTKHSELLRVLKPLLTLGGIIGGLASAIIIVDKIKILEDPSFTPGCSINPIISCGSILESMQSHVFGFPNPLIGVAAFGALVAVGVGLYAGANFKRWFWLGLEAGAIFGVAFVHWLFYQSVFSIGALCLYCMVVWAVTIPIFWYITLYNLDVGHIKVPLKLKRSVGFIRRHHGDILLVWMLVIAILILNHFWYYFKTL